MTAATMAPDSPGTDRPIAGALRDWTLRLPVPAGWVHAATSVDLEFARGEVTAVVGESGCGKSMLLAALTGTLPPGARTGGTVEVDGRTPRTAADWGTLRGPAVAAMPAPAATGLSPTSTVGSQLRQVLRRAARRGARTSTDAPAPSVESLLASVGLDPVVATRHPHQLSGGMAARALLAATVAAGPRLLLCDEPTAALDRDTAAGILELLRELADRGTAVGLITHDVDQLEGAAVADSIAVMYAGRIVQHCPADTFFAAGAALEPYPRALLDSLPTRGFRPIPGLPPELTNLDPGHTFAHRIDSVERFVAPAAGGQPPSVPAADSPTPVTATLVARSLSVGHGADPDVVTDFSLTLTGGTITGLSGPSGAGKTTVARTLAGLHRPRSGSVLLDRRPVRPPSGRFDGRIALLFQSPRQAVDPSMTVRALIAEPITGRRRLSRRDSATSAAVEDLARRVGLTADLWERFPGQLSDGQLQRVCLARAIAQRPRVLLCDEATAMLDAASTASIAGLVSDLCHGRIEGHGQTAVLAISHDRALLAAWADRTLSIGRTERDEPDERIEREETELDTAGLRSREHTGPGT